MTERGEKTTVTPIAADRLADWAGLEAFPPYGYYADFAEPRCRALRARQLAALAPRSDHHPREWRGEWYAEEGVGAFGLSTLGWDTAQFGVPAGRLDYFILAPHPHERPQRTRREEYEASLVMARSMIAEADRLAIRHLSARFDSRELQQIQALEACGFELVDAILRFSLDSDRWFGAPPLPEGVTLRDAREDDIGPLAELARHGFIYDRFHNDPLLAAGVADAVHGEWLTNAIRGKTGDGVLAADVDGKPAGFFILALDRLAGEILGVTIGTLVLITVDRTLRRRGVALALSLGSVDWLIERGATRLEVGTQLANVPAANVYLKAGFRLVQTSVSLRRVAPGPVIA